MHSIKWTFLAVWMASVSAAYGVSCKVIASHTPSEAETAFLHADYDKAAGLYQSELREHPNDSELVAGLTRVLLRQQKVTEASELVGKALTAQPKSAVLLVARGEVEYRQGTPWLAQATANEALKADPCQPRLRLLLARVFRLDSMYASAAREVATAHSLAPNDPDIRYEWLRTLPIGQRITELEAYLASPTGDDAEEIHRGNLYLARLKKIAAEPHKACRLVSSASSTELPFAPIMRDATHVRAYGLDVKLNGHDSRLQIDTGAGGIVVGRATAKRAGLEPFSATEMSGIGSEGAKNGYTAYADKIQIGSLEFHDCEVEVLGSRDVIGSDGLIGMDVLSRFLVTLDYPMRKLILGPLPPRPDDGAAQSASLVTNQDSGEDADEKPAGGSADKPAANAVDAAKQPTARRGPHDRYIAPEMKGYLPVYRIGHDLLLPTAVNRGNPRLFLLDTGSWTTLISTQAAREVGKIEEDSRLQVHGISGKVDKVYTASNLTLDFAGMRQPAKEIVSMDMSTMSKHTGMEISGLIGATTLTQLTMHIDYREGLVKFDYDPNRGYRNRSGNGGVW